MMATGGPGLYTDGNEHRVVGLLRRDRNKAMNPSGNGGWVFE